LIPTLIAAVRTLASVAGVGLYVLLVAPPALLWTVISRDPRFLYVCGGGGVRLGLFLAGIKVVALGTEHIQHGTSAVYAANHASNIEPPVLFHALRSLYPNVAVLYKAELRKIPLLVWVWDAAGFVPIERANPGQSLPAVNRASDALKAGKSFMIFPEGTRSKTGELLPFKKGGFVMAVAAQVPVVPVTITGARNAMRKGSPLVWPATVTVEFAPPVSTAGLLFTQRDDVIKQVRAAIEARLKSTTS
jgi:1-acyl-sn-glycerol-3-phosphate acyltransferase